MIRLVPQIVNLRKFLGAHLRRYLLQDLAAGNLVRQRIDYDVAILDLVRRAQAQCATTGRVHFHELVPGRDELAAGRVIRTLDVFHQLPDRRFWLVEQMH